MLRVAYFDADEEQRPEFDAADFFAVDMHRGMVHALNDGDHGARGDYSSVPRRITKPTLK